MFSVGVNRSFAALSLAVLSLFFAHPAPAATAPVFNIVDFGARRDASAPATEAFKKAIDAAKLAGGGTIFVPAGKYSSGPIELFSNMTLEIDAGAVVALHEGAKFDFANVAEGPHTLHLYCEGARFKAGGRHW